jgi:hypothetical protein
MEFLRDLLEASKKKSKVSRTTARAVYHRDYVKTKKKPYRKYDPADHASLTEDITDTADVSAGAPQDADFEGLHQHLTALVGLLARYDQAKSSSGATPHQDGENPATNPAMQFSSFLYQSFGDFMSEEKWNYNERPPQEGPGGPASVSNVDANSDVQAAEPSANDLASIKQAASQHIRDILGIAKNLGPNAEQQLAQQVAKHCGNKARRVMIVLTQAAHKMGVQL